MVGASNTLDHSYDPIRATGQMVEVTRPGGAAYVEDGRFTVWNADGRWDVGEWLGRRATVELAETTTGRWHQVVLRRSRR